jgi:hypothetical protein
VDEIEDELQHSEHGSECSSEDDDNVPEFAEQVAPTFREEARPASRKRTLEDEEDKVARESKAVKVDASDDIVSREDIFAEVSAGCNFSVLFFCLLSPSC